MNWNQIAADYLAVADSIFNGMTGDIDAVADEIVARVRAGGKVLICGNGGSAADAQHIAGEFINRFLRQDVSDKTSMQDTVSLMRAIIRGV